MACVLSSVPRSLLDKRLTTGELIGCFPLSKNIAFGASQQSKDIIQPCRRASSQRIKYIKVKSYLQILHQLKHPLFRSFSLVLQPQYPLKNKSCTIFSPSKMQASTSAFLEAVKTRRSIYALNNDSPISDARIEEIFHEIILTAPSAFNSQTTRAVLLLNEEHEKFWTMVARLGESSGWPEEMLVRMRGKWDGFKKSKGSVSL